MELILDSRERALIDIFNVNGTDVDFTVKTIEIGDIIFVEKETQDVKMIIERKTITDLFSSITDNRMSSQRARLYNSGAEVFYLIEIGKSDSKRLSEKWLLGFVLSCQLKYNFKIIYTTDVQDTANSILLILTKYSHSSSRSIGFNDLSKMSKRSQEPLFINLLLQINGVSGAVARGITGEYKNIFDLINAYNKLETEIQKELLLQDILVDSGKVVNTKKPRKIGKALSKKIYQQLIFFS